MSSTNYNDRFDDITYEKGWQRASTPETYVAPVRGDTPGKDDNRTADSKTKGKGKSVRVHAKGPFKSLLLTIQLVLCMLILAAALVLKQFGGEMYEEIKTLYFQHLNNSFFQTPQENILDLSEIFGQGVTENTDNTSENSESIEDPSESQETTASTEDPSENQENAGSLENSSYPQEDTTSSDSDEL